MEPGTSSKNKTLEHLLEPAAVIAIAHHCGSSYLSAPIHLEDDTHTMLLKSLSMRLMVIAMLLVVADPTLATGLMYHGELAAQAAVDPDADDNLHASAILRYLPVLEQAWSLPDSRELHAELAGIIRTGISGTSNGDITSDMLLDLHRCWLRMTSPRWELRAGLQKINFGPARLLRVLRWFDTIDPSDPTGYTGGVTGLMLRFTPTPLSILQSWLLVDDSGTQLQIKTRRETLAGGGRIQLPLGRGELALTTHTRLLRDSGRETRLALDGGWDIGVGIWFESLLQHSDDAGNPEWTRLLTIGLDYTFNWGNGLHLLGEQLFAAAGDQPLRNNDVSHLSALMIDYPLNLFDHLSVIMLMDGASSTLALAEWRRAADYWSLHLQGFWSQGGVAAAATALGGDFPDMGIRLTAILYH